MGERVFLAGGAAVHQWVKIGRLVMIQGNSAITQNVLPFTMAAGVNATVGLNVVGLRRAGYDGAERAEIRRAFKLFFASGLNAQQALEKAAALSWLPKVAEFWEFARGCRQRGICKWSGRKAVEADLGVGE